MAVNAGLACALDSFGLDVPDISVLDVSVPYKVRFVLAMCGWSDTSVDLVDGHLAVRGTVNELPETLAFAADVSAELPLDVVAASFTATDGTATRVWEGPWSSLRAFRAESSALRKQLRLVELVRRWTVDGEPMQSATWVRGTMASYVVAADEEPDAKLRVLDPLAATARRLGDRPLIEALGKVRRGYEAIRDGRRPSASFVRGVDRLVEYHRDALAEAS